jgi:hypothetical protein
VKSTGCLVLVYVALLPTTNDEPHHELERRSL